MSKITPGTILLGFLAILFGLVGTWAFREYSTVPSVTSPQPVKPLPKITVPMASRTLASGHLVKVDDIALVKMTRDEMKESGFDKAFMTQADQIVGKTVKTEIRRGKTFDTRELYPEGTGPGIADRLKPGQRAVTVSLTPTNALIGFAGAGQLVDVLFHYGDNSTSERPDANRVSAQSAAYQSATVTLVQKAKILALGSSAVPTQDANGIDAESRVLVTLAVKPADAEAIRVAAGNGELSLTLRNPIDQDALAELGAPKLLSEIIEIDSGTRQMEIYRGNQLTRVEFNQKSPGRTTRSAGPDVVDGTPPPISPTNQQAVPVSYRPPQRPPSLLQRRVRSNVRPDR